MISSNIEVKKDQGVEVERNIILDFFNHKSSVTFIVSTKSKVRVIPLLILFQIAWVIRIVFICSQVSTSTPRDVPFPFIMGIGRHRSNKITIDVKNLVDVIQRKRFSLKLDKLCRGIIDS